MGRLKGVVAVLGMQVTYFLANLLHYPLVQPLPEGAPVFELSQQDLNVDGTKFCRYKQDMNADQQRHFSQVEVDGKVRMQFFIKCWEGLQLLLSKVADKGVVAKRHGTLLVMSVVSVKQVSRDVAVLQAQIHELNDVASVLKSFPGISSSIASKLNVSTPSNVSTFEQGLLFVPHTHSILKEMVFGMPHTPYAIAASPDAKLVGDGCALLLEVKCACPFLERDDGRGWIYSPFKKALGEKGVSVKYFVQCWVQMLAANISFCLLAGWEVKTCKVMCVQFDEDWCGQMLCMLSCILMAAAPLSGRPPNFSRIPRYKEFAEFTLKHCEAVAELCSIESVKGDVDGRWL